MIKAESKPLHCSDLILFARCWKLCQGQRSFFSLIYNNLLNGIHSILIKKSDLFCSPPPTDDRTPPQAIMDMWNNERRNLSPYARVNFSQSETSCARFLEVFKSPRVEKTWLPCHDLGMIIPWSWHDHTMIMAQHGHDHAMMLARQHCCFALLS